jgi:hypothetical protein
LDAVEVARPSTGRRKTLNERGSGTENTIVATSKQNES